MQPDDAGWPNALYVRMELSTRPSRDLHLLRQAISKQAALAGKLGAVRSWQGFVRFMIKRI